MSLSKKEIHSHMAKNLGVYLNHHQLNHAVDVLNKSTNVFGTLTDLEAEFDVQENKGTNAKNKSAYILEENKSVYHKKVCRPIYQLDKTTGEILNRYDSLYQAAKSIGTKGFGAISMCANRRINSAYGFRWQFVPQD